MNFKHYVSSFSQFFITLFTMRITNKLQSKSNKTQSTPDEGNMLKRWELEDKNSRTVFKSNKTDS